jgi:hypothetical protein
MKKVSKTWLERHSAYRIDPLLAQQVEIDPYAGLCRIDGEIDGGDLWKERHQTLWLYQPPAVR